MCKGLGRRQRTILETLRPGVVVELRELLPADFSEADCQSTLRAVRGLADAGRVRLSYWSTGTRPARHRMTIQRP